MMQVVNEDKHSVWKFKIRDRLGDLEVDGNMA
jgi:hypothetical protein